MRRNRLLLLLLALAALQACNKNLYYSEQADVREKGWNMAEPVAFEVQVDDTTGVYDCYIDVRNSSNFDKANLFLFINSTFPNGDVARDTLECPLADIDGRWYGKSTGRYIDSRYFFKRRIIFPEKGTYRFEILHAMRDTSLAGIRSIGFRVEHAAVRQ